jgi:2-haloacid dehalogenase
MRTAYVFDAYGTLFDVHSAVHRHVEQIGPDATRLSDIWRTKQLEYSWVCTLIGDYQDFWALTEQALDFAMSKIGIRQKDLREQLLDAYRRLDCYPEVLATLAALKAKGAKLGILSNGSTAMLQAAVSSANLSGVFDNIWSVDAVREFKPAAAVYTMVTRQWDLPASEVVFISSNRWDIAGAAQFGFHAIWINRTNQTEEYRAHPPKHVLRSLAELISGTKPSE